MKLKVIAQNDAVDSEGRRNEAYDVVDDNGRQGWLRPAVRSRLQNGTLSLKPGDMVVATDFVAGGGQFPTLVAENIQKLPQDK